MSLIAVKYFSSSFSGFVSSYLKKQIPLFAYKRGEYSNIHTYADTRLFFPKLNRGVIEEKIHYLCIAKVEVDSFGMSNVKNAVGLRRKTSTNLMEFVN